MRSKFVDFAHVLIGKPVATFPRHALAFANRFGPANSPSKPLRRRCLPKRHRTRRSCALVENARRIGDWRYMSQIKSIGLATNLCKPARTGHQSAQAEFTHLRASERIPIRSNRGCAPNSLIFRM